MKDDRAPLVDAAARERAASDLGASFCVEAGAGTGKTTLLVSRFLSIVERGAAPCTRIVAITFTEKAAGEMKVRLREKIHERLGDRALSAAARANLEAAASELERAPISTIHSFAATILREHPIEAGLDPGFVQLDALESDLFFDECWNDFLRAGAEAWEDTLLRFTRFGGSVETLRALADAVYERRGERACERLFNGAGAPPVPQGGEARCGGGRGEARRAPAAKAPSTLREEFTRAAARLSELARDCCVNPEDRGKAVVDEFVERMRAIGGLDGDESSYALLTLALPAGKGNKGNWRPAEACAEQKEIFKNLAALQERERTRVSDDLRERIEGFTDDFLAFVAKRKSAQGILDFDDLLIHVRELLANDAALDALRERYRYLLVDEFQDTDPVQAEIVWLLAGAPGSRGAGEPEPGKLFIVGDPKQSIYRFRKADIEMYQRVKDRLAGSGAVLSITQNFRSVPGIVAWVNETFAEAMAPEDGSPFQARYEPIHPRRSGAGDAIVPVELELDGDKAKAGEIREREGETVARLIHRLREEGVAVRDAKTGVARPLQYGDIAVIYPGTTGIDNYEDPLRAEGIPYIVEGGKLYYAREEIRDLAAALWAIEDPYDELALVATLRSPMFGASDEEIFLFTRAGGRLDYLAPGAGACGAFEGLGSAFALLAELHRGRNELGPSGTILELLRRTKYLELSLLRPHGEQSVSNIRKAVSSARAFEGKIGSYRRFARWFKDQEALASAESESSVIEEQENAVRLLTVHKAKGLQFPVVILANLVQSRRRPKQGVFVERGRRISFDLGLLRTSDFAALAENEKRREEAEMVRLLYVAATRAGDRLIIPRIPKTGSYYDLVRSHLEPGETPALCFSGLPPLRGETRPFVRFSEPRANEKKKAAALRSAWIGERAALLERARRSPAVIAPSQLAAEAFARAASAEDAFEQADAARAHALAFGLAFHKVMELADLSSTRGLAALAASTASALGIPEDAGELERLASAALGSALIARAERSRRCLRETPFTIPWEGGFIEGRIDLLFEDASGWTLVDYKTDDVAAPDVDAGLAMYRPQAAVYALALKALGVECRGGIALYFARPGVVKTIELSTGLEEEAERLIRGAIATTGDA